MSHASGLRYVPNSQALKLPAALENALATPVGDHDKH